MFKFLVKLFRRKPKTAYKCPRCQTRFMARLRNRLKYIACPRCGVGPWDWQIDDWLDE